MLAIHGDHDEFGSIRHPERIVELTAGPSSIEMLAGCGHVPHRERREAVIERVRTRLDAMAI